MTAESNGIPPRPRQSGFLCSRADGSSPGRPDSATGRRSSSAGVPSDSRHWSGGRPTPRRALRTCRGGHRFRRDGDPRPQTSQAARQHLRLRPAEERPGADGADVQLGLPKSYSSTSTAPNPLRTVCRGRNLMGTWSVPGCCSDGATACICGPAATTRESGSQRWRQRESSRRPSATREVRSSSLLVARTACMHCGTTTQA